MASDPRSSTRWPFTPQCVVEPSFWPAGAQDSVDLLYVLVAPPPVNSWNVALTVAPPLVIELLTKKNWPSLKPATGWNWAPRYGGVPVPESWTSGDATVPSGSQISR